MTISQINPNQLRPNGDDGQGRIIRVGPDRQVEAIACLLAGGGSSDRDQARRFIEYAADHRINLDLMWSRLDAQGRVSATVLGVPNPGRTAMMFASRATGAAQVRATAGLIDHACGGLMEFNVNLAQVLMPPGETVERETFDGAGFRELAVLSYLERPIKSIRSRVSPPRWPPGVMPVAYDDSMRAELLDVLERSYEETLDCPGLRGHRTTRDILEGHRASGRFDPKLWTLLREGRRTVGALLLNPSADQQSVELVYLGLAKEARGSGLGSHLLRYGLHLLATRSERTVNLAVDETNAPALKLYEREGFKPVLRRLAMIRPLG